MEESYQPQKIEEKIQHYWEAHKLFHVTEDSSKEKFYCLTMFPYPSGHLHMGHVRVYTIGDVLARYQRMLGKNVMQPMGWDAFGLPAENAAIKNKTAPAEWTYKNIDFMRNQMVRMGLSYDWSRELATCDPEYYHWEQWLFLQLYKKGLVYKKNAEVNWDPVDNTVLANEQVIDGRGWRSGALVERREIPQWFFKITAYAEELLNDLDTLTHWPEQVKTMQRNWIGRSEGVEIQFPVLNHSDVLTIYTTRPDTLFGVTYVAIAPQHPLAEEAAKSNPALAQFIEECRHLKTAEADFATMEKRGVLTEFKALHPFTHEELPIWVANFVVMEYGAGAVMAVPAHDQRDFEFAKQYHLPIKSVISPHDQTQPDITEAAFTAKGILKDSAQFTDLDSETACGQIIDALEKQHLGKRKIHFRLRDWGISRQRYWGAPIPMINCPVCGTVPAAENSLPITLPENVTLNGTTSPLKNMPEFYETTCPQCHGTAQRETDTFDTFFESSWYYARYACKDQDKVMLDERAKYWTPVDQYVGGIEHAILHLLYARFLHKAIRDEGLLDSDEPFTRLLAQGMVLNQGAKMSKSVGNTVDPEKLIAQFGADTVRLFMIFAAPPEQNLEWSDSGVEGAHRFLKRLWTQAYEHRALIQNENKKSSFHFDTMDWNLVDAEQKNILRQLYEITEQCKYDYERQQLNTVVSGCMKLFNLLLKLPEPKNLAIDIRPYLLHQGFSMLLSLLSPIAPHITHQLWEDLGYPGLMMHAAWPKTHLDKLKADHIELGVQINGKLRSRITIPAGAEKSAIEKIALDDAKVHQAISGKSIKKIIIVPGKLVNIVIGET